MLVLTRKRLPSAATGVRDIKVRRKAGSGGLSLLPVILKPAIEAAAAQGGDGVGAAYCPEHTRSFQAGSDHCLATSFNHARANEESFGAKLWIVHAAGVGSEEVRLFQDLLCQASLFGGDLTQARHQWCNLAAIQQTLHRRHPALLRHQIMGIEQGGDV